MRREEEMTDVEKQEERDTQRDLGVTYKLSNLIKEIRKRNNEWANNKKVQKGEKRYEVQKSSGNGPIRDIRPSTGVLHLQAWNVEGSVLNHYITEEGEIGSWARRKKKEKEIIGQELKRFMLARTRDKQACKARTEGKEHQELLKSGTEENALKKLSKEAQNREHESVGQHVKPGENVYYVGLASDEAEDKGTEAQTDWETRLAKKLELKLNLKRKRENK
ncbi:hypothetical protein Ahy_A05g022104 isoform B [Arachis hypogaea]|uniref:Uncharacterized protein n=1 Tax=Arachis hypogaea TaxID=3818 RepID=A0A445CZY3_ARAHY|nr:hypothetical protein Ahy_A05g022104 isoform B [Arachis hypogaea]